MAQDRAARRIRHILDALQAPNGVSCTLDRAICRAEEAGGPPSKVCTADEAVALIKDGSMVTVRGEMRSWVHGIGLL